MFDYDINKFKFYYKDTIMSDLKIGISGCSGKMGRTILKLISSSNDCTISGGLEASNNQFVGIDLGKLINDEPTNVTVGTDRSIFFNNCDVVIDFSTPKSTNENIDYAVKSKKAIVIGTTGLNKETEFKIMNASKTVPIVYSANMSIGINILLELTKKISNILDQNDFDIEILEMHHKHSLQF